MENIDAEISMEIGALMFSMEFHGKCPNPPCKYFPWKSMEKFPWNSMEIDVLILHGIPWRIFHGIPWRFFTWVMHSLVKHVCWVKFSTTHLHVLLSNTMILQASPKHFLSVGGGKAKNKRQDYCVTLKPKNELEILLSEHDQMLEADTLHLEQKALWSAQLTNNVLAYCSQAVTDQKTAWLASKKNFLQNFQE